MNNIYTSLIASFVKEETCMTIFEGEKVSRF